MTIRNDQDGQNDFRKILSAIDKFRNVERSTAGVIYTDNWYDSHPRLLIFDPILSPYDKLVWLAIRANCSPDMSLTAFPSYDQIQANLHISRGTVATSISKLRLTRWITLLCREQVRNSSGQFKKDGNIYMVHGEPLGLSDTFNLDVNYMGYLHRSSTHRNSEVRRISNLILSSICRNVDQDKNVLINEHPFERRAEAWNSVKGNQDASFFEFNTELTKTLPHQDQSESSNLKFNTESTAVHQADYGPRDSAVQIEDYGQNINKITTTTSGSGSSSSSDKNKNNYNIQFDGSHELNQQELNFHSSLSKNQEHLIVLHLKRLPQTLPPVPPPWKSWYQLLLDELAGRINMGNNSRCEAVWNPVSLMATYCQRLVSNGIGLKEDGQFQIEHAEAVHKKRSKLMHSKSSYDAVLKNYRDRIDQARKK